MLEGKTALHAIRELNECNAFYQVKNRIGQCGVYCFNAGVAFAGCRQVYFDFGFSAGWPDYQFVLAFQVILQHIGTRQTGIFRAAAVFSVGGLRYRCPRPYRREVKRLWLRGRVVR